MKLEIGQPRIPTDDSTLRLRERLHALLCEAARDALLGDLSGAASAIERAERLVVSERPG